MKNANGARVGGVNRCHANHCEAAAYASYTDCLAWCVGQARAWWIIEVTVRQGMEVALYLCSQAVQVASITLQQERAGIEAMIRQEANIVRDVD
jgi:hypothetical protein